MDSEKSFDLYNRIMCIFLILLITFVPITLSLLFSILCNDWRMMWVNIAYIIILPMEPMLWKSVTVDWD